MFIHKVYYQFTLCIHFHLKVGVDKGEGATDNTYQKLLTKLPDVNGASPYEVYGSIEDTMASVEKYCQEWLSFQSLWDLEMNNVLPKLETLEIWMNLLNEIK